MALGGAISKNAVASVSKAALKGFCRVTAASAGSSAGGNVVEIYMSESTEAKEPASLLEQAKEIITGIYKNITPKTTGAFLLASFTAVGFGAISVPGSLIGTAAYYGGYTIAVRVGKELGGKAGEKIGDSVVYPVYFTIYPKDTPLSQIMADSSSGSADQKLFFDTQTKMEEHEARIKELAEAIVALKKARDMIVGTDLEFNSAELQILEEARSKLIARQEKENSDIQQLKIEHNAALERCLNEFLLRDKSVIERLEFYQERLASRSEDYPEMESTRDTVRRSQYSRP